jgi:NAD(P)-dependent dehydrogenase (short-subunit alcohol dehydrogenase family)
MARIFITGSADGLGRLAAQTLLADGHEVVVHARNTERAAALDDLRSDGAQAVVGDLAVRDDVLRLADEADQRGDEDREKEQGERVLLQEALHRGALGQPWVRPTIA